MSDEVSSEFPLFPLGLVALPGELVPLHIFEERYKTMMAGASRPSSEFGIVWLVRRRAARHRLRDARSSRCSSGWRTGA